MKYVYSIIIPHYNIPQLLKRCLNSIPHRPDLQIIVVDDCSEKQYLSSLQCLEIEFPYVSFCYLSKGGGGGKARNEGLKLARGHYVLFADADDFFNYCIGDILEEYKDTEYDVVYFNANSVDTDSYVSTFRCMHLNKMIRMYEKKPQKAVFDLKYKFGEPWCKMVKRELIEKNGIRFSETIIHNDTKFSYTVGYHSNNIHVDKHAFYCVTERVGSVSKCFSVNRLFIRTQIFAEATVYLYNHGIIYNNEPFLYFPLFYFIRKGDLVNARQCILIMKEMGMTNQMILKGCLSFLSKKCINLPLKFMKGLILRNSNIDFQ